MAGHWSILFVCVVPLRGRALGAGLDCLCAHLSPHGASSGWAPRVSWPGGAGVEGTPHTDSCSRLAVWLAGLPEFGWQHGDKPKTNPKHPPRHRTLVRALKDPKPTEISSKQTWIDRGAPCTHLCRQGGREHQRSTRESDQGSAHVSFVSWQPVPYPSRYQPHTRVPVHDGGPGPSRSCTHPAPA